MPGIVVFRRRWSVGSDDLVVPTIFMIVMHVAWLIVLAVVRGVVKFVPGHECTSDLRNLILGHLVILSVCIVLEIAIAFVSTRGSILTQAPRASIEYLLYARSFLGLVELGWLITGAVWASEHYSSCSPDAAKRALLGVMLCNWLMVLLLIICLWCTFDSAGAKWVKMKKFQDSIRERRQNNPRRGTNRRQSGSRRNWRQRSVVFRQFFSRKMQRMRRKAFRAYEESWDRRLQLLCCCVERKGHNRNSMSEIAALFTDFFRDLDVVPSDIVAGLVLLRKYQKQRMNYIVSQGSNDVYQFLSGVPVTPQTRFLQLSQPDVMDDFQRVTHYMRFALAVYGWPVYVMMHPGTWCCRLLPLFRCCCSNKQQNVEIVEDNCCLCNYSTTFRIRGLHDFELVYCTYHVDIGETPFFVALDHVYKKVVVAIRGTLSLQDVLTDLKAEPETLPLTPPKDDWQGHKGMVQAAVYIKKKLINDGILQMAWDRDEAYCASSDLLKSERETAKYDLVLVGHSLGAGTAAILAILLKPDHPNLHCYAYSPPGGLLTLPCVEETKSYITSVVVGKDCVPRIGLPQLEMLRADILNHIKKTTDAKWKIISRGLMCCNRYSDDIPPGEMLERDVTAHPSNSAIGLSAHLPLFPPGRMIHVVRSHPRNQRTTGIFANAEPIYQAIWANNGDFDEVLVSPTMVNDHMPDNVLDALEKVVIRVAPDKPGHTLTEEQRLEMLNNPSCSSLPSPEASDTNNSHSHEEHYQRNQAGNSFRNPECSEGAEGGEALEEMEEQLNYGTSASPYHARQEEDVVIAPLASPETLSVASGLSAIGAFSPSSSLMGRDLLRHSLQKCAQKQLDSPSEADIETGEECKSRLLDLARGPSSGSSRSKKSSLNKTSINLDPEAGDDILDRGDDYTVKLRSGNTICVKAEVVNEMVRQGDRAESVSSLSQGIPDSVYSGGQSASEESSAVLEPSSHIHVTAHPPTKCLNSNKLLSRPDDTQTNFTHSNPPNSDHRPASPPQDINLSAIDRQGGGDENDKNPSQVGDYVRHSPLDQSNQHEYGHPNTYYTHAGVGYPNNAFHTPQRFLSFPSDEAKHLVEELCKEDISVEENDSAFVPIDDPVTSEVSEQKDDADGDSLPTDPLIPKLNARETVEDQFSTTSFSKPQIALRGKKIFKKAESDNCLLAGGKLSPRMRRSAEQDDIAHLCDALEVFESEEDKARLCQSVSMIVGEDDNENGDTDDNLISGRDGSDDAAMSPGVSETPNLKATTSALVPASGKRKAPNNQSVSFGGSVVIPTLQGGVESGFNGQPNHDTGSNLDTYTQNSSTEIPSTAYAEETTLEGQNLQLSSVPSETESEESPSVSGDIHTKPTVQQLTSASVADILNDRDSFSTMLQETHL